MLIFFSSELNWFRRLCTFRCTSSTPLSIFFGYSVPGLSFEDTVFIVDRRNLPQAGMVLVFVYQLKRGFLRPRHGSSSRNREKTLLRTPFHTRTTTQLLSFLRVAVREIEPALFIESARASVTLLADIISMAYPLAT